MHSLTMIFRKTIYIAAAILAGICLFMIPSAYSINKTFLDTEYHQKLFVKNNLYVQTYNVLKSSMKDFIQSQKEYSTQNYETHKDFYQLLENSVTQEFVNTNLDSLREDLFHYLNGQRHFLPDINLNTLPDQFEQEQASDASEEVKLTSRALSRISKINLSAILLYINRSDITGYLSVLKLIYFIMHKLIIFPALLFLILFLFVITLSKRFSDVVKWIALSFLAGGILSAAGGVVTAIFSHFSLPASISPVVMSFPLQADVIVSYLRDITVPVATVLIITGISAISFSAVLLILLSRFPDLFSWKLIYQPAEKCKVQNLLKNLILAISFIITLSFTVYYTDNFIKNFRANEFSLTIAKLKNSNTVTQVIAAKNDSIYTLQIKLQDGISSIPISEAGININGQSSTQGKNYNETASTDSEGIAKFTLDKGTFRFSFIPEFFPVGYQLPAPFFFDIDTIGTTVITVNIDKIPQTNINKWGIIEIEILNSSNLPVTDLELIIDGSVNAPGDPDKIYSEANKEGIATFKINEGSYNISFTKKNFPTIYIIPSPFEVTSTADSVTRYTIRLVDK